MEEILAKLAEFALEDLIPLGEKIAQMIAAKRLEAQQFAEAQVQAGDAAIDAELAAKS